VTQFTVRTERHETRGLRVLLVRRGFTAAQRGGDSLVDTDFGSEYTLSPADARELARELLLAIGHDMDRLERTIIDERERTRVAELERDILLADLKAAAGGLPVEVPEPGTVMARLVLANRLLRAKVHRLEQAESDRAAEPRAWGRVVNHHEGRAQVRCPICRAMTWHPDGQVPAACPACDRSGS
jgi:hypothetical protein